MNFNEFMGILNGEYKETAGTSAKNQCVDLANAYIRFVLGLPIIEWTDAKDFPLKAGDKYEYIINTPTDVPTEGDLVVWSSNHIAIFIEGNIKNFKSFDENYPTGSPCHVQEHNYDTPKVSGWLHPKETQPDLQIQLDQVRGERDRNWNWYTGLCEALRIGTNYDIAVANAEKLVSIESALEQKQKAWDLEKEEYKKQIQVISDQLKVAEEANTETLTKLNKEIDEREAMGRTLRTAGKTIETLQNKINQFETPKFTGIKQILYNWLFKIRG